MLKSFSVWCSHLEQEVEVTLHPKDAFPLIVSIAQWLFGMAPNLKSILGTAAKVADEAAPVVEALVPGIAPEVEAVVGAVDAVVPPTVTVEDGA